MIYAVHILERKFVKIGFSAAEDVAKRIAELQTGNPFEIKVVLTVDGTLRQEKELHAALTSAFGRIRVPMPPNEWYPGTIPLFEEFLEHLPFGPNQGLAFLDKYDPAVRQPGKKGNFDPNFKWPKLSKTMREKGDAALV